MANLYFRYGTMASSKSANLLMSAYNYKIQNKEVLLFKPATDTRSEEGFIESRVGLKEKAIVMGTESNFLEEITKHLHKNIQCIFVDEIQFFTKEHIRQLKDIVDNYNIPVLCYGLKNSYVDGELFPCISELLFQANRIEEVKSVCEHKNCNSAATHHLRIVNGKPIREGSPVKVGDNIVSEDYYISCCRKHYYNYDLS